MTITLKTHYYRQFDADYDLDVPGEGFGGWTSAHLPLAPEHTAVVLMHAWDTGTYEQYPGWWRQVEYIPRAEAICKTVFPGLLAAVRASSLPLFHVVGGGDYYRERPGYKETVKLAGPAPPAPPGVESDPVSAQLREFKEGLQDHNREDTDRGFANLTFPAEAAPVDAEPIAENAHQLFALCREHGINHLVYIGFAINWCLLLSPGGMADMQKHGLMCSTIRQAVTAVENKESARRELAKEIGLWRVALAFGFVYDVDDFVAAIH